MTISDSARRAVLVLTSIVVFGMFAPLAGDGPRPIAAQDGGPVVLDAGADALVANPTGDQTLRLAGPLDGPYTLDPALARELATVTLARQVFRGLTRLDDALRPEPELAQRIEIAPDGLRYTFDLRPGATFHVGSPIEAEDVAVSLARALDPETAGGDAALLGGPTYLSDIAGAADVLADRADALAGVTVLGPLRLEIRLAAPRSTFLMKLAGVPAAVVDPTEAAEGGEWWRAPNGSGPFAVAEWVEAERLVLTGAPGYVRGAPALTRVEILLGPGASLPFNLYQSGAVDFADVPLGALDRALDPDGGTRGAIVETPTFSVYYAAFRTDIAPMDDPHIRRAVQLGFSRPRLADVGFNARLAAASGLVPPGMLGRDWPVDAAFDLDAARAEIAASRYGTAEAVPPIRVYTPGDGAIEAVAKALAVDLGLRVEVLTVAGGPFFDDLARRAFPAYAFLWVADFPDPESVLGTLFGGDSADNYVDYRNPAFDALLAEAATELDPARRADRYAEANRLLLADAVVLPLYHEVAYTAVGADVRGLTITPLGLIGLESVWLER